MHFVQVHAPGVMRWSGLAPRRPGVSGHCRANSTTAPPPKQYLHRGNTPIFIQHRPHHGTAALMLYFGGYL
jgi:hypothetical protein